MKKLKTNEIKYWEYTNDRIKYINSQGIESTYLLDFKVTKNDDTWFYLETKGYQTPNDILKWNAVKEAGFELKVFFDEDIREIENCLF